VIPPGQSGQYVAERAVPADGSMPSPLLACRDGSLCGVVGWGRLFAVTNALVAVGVYSRRCVARVLFGRGRILDLVSGVAVLLLAGVIAQGWKGKLPGARRA
jgi:hypothetical protein